MSYIYYGVNCDKYCTSYENCNDNGICNQYGECECYQDDQHGYWQDDPNPTTDSYTNKGKCSICIPTNDVNERTLENNCGRNYCDNYTCNGRGVCNDQNECDCNENYEGKYCNRCELNKYNWPSCNVECTADTTCNGHGSCDTIDGSCICDSSNETGYWTGTYCDICQPGYVGEGCNVYNDVSICNSKGVLQINYIEETFHSKNDINLSNNQITLQNNHSLNTGDKIYYSTAYRNQEQNGSHVGDKAKFNIYNYDNITYNNFCYKFSIERK